MTFGEKLKQLRNEAGLSLTMLAQATGLSRSAIVQYESGRRNPSLEVAIILARAFGHKLRIFEDCESKVDAGEEAD